MSASPDDPKEPSGDSEARYVIVGTLRRVERLQRNFAVIARPVEEIPGPRPVWPPRPKRSVQLVPMERATPKPRAIRNMSDINP
jgi:hypothetical protein